MGISLHEMILWMAFGIGLVRWLIARLAERASPQGGLRASPFALSGLDYPVLLFLAVGLLATVNAARFGFALYDFRTVFLTPAHKTGNAWTVKNGYW